MVGDDCEGLQLKKIMYCRDGVTCVVLVHVYNTQDSILTYTEMYFLTTSHSIIILFFRLTALTRCHGSVSLTLVNVQQLLNFPSTLLSQ